MLQPGPALLRRFVRNKADPLCDEIEHLEANPNFAYIRYPDGRESTVSTEDLAPCPDTVLTKTNRECLDDSTPPNTRIRPTTAPTPGTLSQPVHAEHPTDIPPENISPVEPVRRSTRERNAPVRFGDWVG